MRRRLLRPALSVVVLATWIAGVVGPVLLPHSGRFDIVCSDEEWTSPHPRTQFEAVLPAVADSHCAVCHLQRVARGAIADLGRQVRGHEIVVLRPATTQCAAAGAVAIDVPARAPPTALL